tara:strand:+ start:639 stop:1424 length:786 start_codon:yes stop_codon:yes gene_type:complete
MNEFIIYEQPVSENTRNFLKCEYLFEKFNASLSQHNIWSIKSCLSTLIEISDYISRINLKVELLKELEKNIFYLDNLKDKEIFNISKYDNYYSQTKTCIDNLNKIDNNPSKSIFDNDFLMQVKSKLHIPAGDNFFDMPSYLNFLTSNKNLITTTIEDWFEPFNPIYKASALILEIKRTSVKFKEINNKTSYYEEKLDNKTKIDLVRIKLEKDINVYPDISVNRQNININFKRSYSGNRLSKAIDNGIKFEISLGEQINYNK